MSDESTNEGKSDEFDPNALFASEEERETCKQNFGRLYFWLKFVLFVWAMTGVLNLYAEVVGLFL